MDIIALLFALITSTIFILLYVKAYNNYFVFNKMAVIGKIILLLAIYIQFVAIYLDLNIKVLAAFSFITYPISFLLIFKTNIFNNLYLSLNAILKIYAAFILFGTLLAVFNDVQYQVSWITNSYYYNIAQGSAYLLSIGSLLIVDFYLIKDKMAYFFKLKKNLILIIFIQIIFITNLVWLSMSDNNIAYGWFNTILIAISFSVDILYFLLRLYTANSSYYITFISQTENLKKQLDSQLDHYKTYESQMTSFLEFKHDYDKFLKGVSHLISIKDFDGLKAIVNDYQLESKNFDVLYKKYSNNLILDALLNDYSKKFEKIGAKFDSLTFINLKQMTELDLIRLFYNILDNAYESLIQINDVNNRKISVTTNIVNNYLKISFINTTTNKSITNLKSSKEDLLNHGLGIAIIDEILEKYDGFSNRFITYENDLVYYNLELFLPKE